MRIVPFAEHNLDDVVTLGAELHDLTPFAKTGPAYDAAFARRMVIGVMDHDAYYCRLAYDDTDCACGFLGGHVVPFYFSAALGAYVDLWFVRPGTVGRGRIAKSLMQGFIDWAFIVHGAVMIQGGDEVQIDRLAIDYMLRQFRFVPSGTLYKRTR